MPITISGGLGAAISPEQWAAYVLTHLSAQSVVLASGATRVDTPNRVVNVPKVLTDGQADWFGELEEIVTAEPTGDDLVLEPKKCAALTRLSSEAVNDSNPSVLDAVGTAMTRAVSLKADAGLTTPHVVGVDGLQARLDRPSATPTRRRRARAR